MSTLSTTALSGGPQRMHAKGLLIENQALTYDELAPLVKMSVRTLQRRVAAGTIPFHKDGGLVRFFWPEIEAWLRGVWKPKGRKRA